MDNVFVSIWGHPLIDCKRKSPTTLVGKDEEEIQIHSHDRTVVTTCNQTAEGLPNGEAVKSFSPSTLGKVRPSQFDSPDSPGLESHQRCFYFPSFLAMKMFSGADKTAHAAASTRQPPLFTSRQALPVFAAGGATTSLLKMDFTWSQNPIMTLTAHVCEASATLVPCDTPVKDAV